MFFWATEKEKRRALSEFEIRFLPDEEKCKTKMEVQFAFPLQRKTKNENTIWVSFSYAIENRLALRYTDYCSIIVLVFGSSSMYSPGHTSILAAKIVSLTFLSELRTKTAIPIRSVQSVDCIPGKKCRLVTKCRLQIADRVQNADWQFVLFFRLILDHMSYYNLPNVTQALFRDHLSRLFALLSNIPCLFLDHNRS